MAEGPTPQTFGSVDIPDTAFDDAPEAPAAPVEAPAPEDPAAPVETPAVEAPAPGADAEADPFDTGADSFPRDYVEKLRRESANYRERSKPFAETFEGIEESDRDVFLSLAQLYKTDPIAAGREMARLAQGLVDSDSSDEPAPVSPNGDNADSSPNGYMTESRYAEIKRQEAVEAAATQIEADAKGFGYNKGTPEYTYLLAVAQTKNGDLAQAHAYIQGREQEAVSKYVAGKTADAAGSPTAPTESGAPVSSERSLKTWRDAEAAIDEVLG